MEVSDSLRSDVQYVKKSNVKSVNQKIKDTKEQERKQLLTDVFPQKGESSNNTLYYTGTHWLCVTDSQLSDAHVAEGFILLYSELIATWELNNVDLNQDDMLTRQLNKITHIHTPSPAVFNFNF